MKKTAWQEVKRTLTAALALPEEEREDFLRACGEEEEVRREVASLLASGEERVQFLEEPIFRFDEGPSRLGDDIGSYRLIRLLGRGGMGTVYLAQRQEHLGDDKTPELVAIKVLDRGFNSEEVRRRFRNEWQILANLEHPNIAHLIDVDTTADGSPCLVMEYIEGEPIHHYCARQGLSVVKRLELFCEVCAAVQYAHQCLVIHRDLKPGNILVTAEGTPKLLDFGIAKLLDPESFTPVTETAQGLRFMTPEYASPEQVRCEAMTTSSDVYSLGVLLYELLTGQRPYRLPSGLREEVARVICHETPEKPSLALGCLSDEPAAVREEQGRLRRQLTGDLDTIALMCLRKEAARRYSSVEQLSEDIERHLGGLPVRARGDGFSYRAGKFLRRHRLPVAFAATLLVVIFLFSSALARQQQKTANEHARAMAMGDFLIGLFKQHNLTSGESKTLTTREVLDRGATIVLQQPVEDLAVQAQLVATIATAYDHLGEVEEAKALLAGAEADQEEGGTEPDPELVESLARLTDALSQLDEHLQDLGEPGVAEPLLLESLKILERFLPADDPRIRTTRKVLLGIAGDHLVVKGQTVAVGLSD